MPQQITMRDLDGVVKRLNQITRSPLTPWEHVNGQNVANIGNYHLDGAYGGWKLERMVNEHGGVTDVLYSGYESKRELYGMIHAYIRGIEAGYELATGDSLYNREDS